MLNVWLRTSRLLAIIAVGKSHAMKRRKCPGCSMHFQSMMWALIYGMQGKWYSQLKANSISAVSIFYTDHFTSDLDEPYVLWMRWKNIFASQSVLTKLMFKFYSGNEKCIHILPKMNQIFFFFKLINLPITAGRTCHRVDSARVQGQRTRFASGR